MSASVEIETDRKEGVVTVPLQAVTQEGFVFLYDSTASCVKAVKVTTGIQDIGDIEITSGLPSPDSVWIVTGPYGTVSKMLEDGMKVNAEFESKNTEDE